MVRMYLNQSVETANRAAVFQIQSGRGDKEAFNKLWDMHSLLCIGAQMAKDKSLAPVLHISSMSLLNMRDRWLHTGKVGCAGDELQAMFALADTFYDFWARQSSARLEMALEANRRLKEKLLNTGAEK